MGIELAIVILKPNAYSPRTLQRHSFNLKKREFHYLPLASLALSLSTHQGPVWTRLNHTENMKRNQTENKERDKERETHTHTHKERDRTQIPRDPETH